MRTRKIHFIVFTIFFTLLAFGVSASEPATNAIKIDNKKNVLIAPESSSYKWFCNGKQISFSGRELKIMLPGTYQVKTIDQHGKVLVSTIQLGVSANGNIIQIFVIGDSTVSSYTASQYPWTGWGQILNLFFDPNKVAVNNRARGGRSSRSYYQEGIWTNVKAELDSGNYVFIQFGHNDRDYSHPERYTTPDSMKNYLRIYINDSRAKGAIPVLVSPMSMNTGTRNVFTESGSDYRGAMLSVAQEMNVPFLDLNTRSYNFYQQVGTEYASYFIHMGLMPGEYPNYPDGYSDTYTHYQEMGALAMARMITLEIKDKQSNPELAPLADALKPLYHVGVELKNPNAAMATISGDYPQGATITLKSRNSGHLIMKNWVDSANNITLNGNLVKFTMAAHNYNFVGNLVDCNGTSYGTATYDTCGVCTGGTTKLDPCSNNIQFVDFCNTNTNAQINLDSKPYKIYLRTDSVDNAYISQKFNVAKTDSFYFAINYNNPGRTTLFNVYVNDTLRIMNMPLLTTTSWSVAKFYLHLIKGQNTIKFQRNRLTSGVGTLLNYLAIYSQDISKVNCNVNTQNMVGAFVQKDSLIVIEAENYSQSKAGSNGHKWLKAKFDNASKEKVVISPTGTTYSTAVSAQTDAPVLSYNVDFPAAGNYSVWARVYAFDTNSDAYDLGLNSEVKLENINVSNSTKVYQKFTWLHIANNQLVINKAGVQTLDLYCSDPNLIIDKIILSPDANYSPVGAGPDETLDQTDTIAGVDNLLANDPDLGVSVYPNPVHNQMRIAYNLNQSNYVNISILNMDGQLISNLIDKYQAFGKHEFSWNFAQSDSNIKQGIYLIKFQIGHSLKTQKVLVVYD